MRWVATLVVSICLVGDGSTLHAGQDRDWRAWADLVNAHEPGMADAALREAATWSHEDLQDAIAGLPRAGPVELVRTLSRALALHTDIAIHFRIENGYALPAGGESMSILADGREVGWASRTFHWEIGRSIVGLIPDARERTRVGRLWYRATSAWLQLWGEYPELRLQLEAGLDVLEDDPVLLLYEGTTHQAYARPLVQQALEELRRAGRPNRIRAAAAGMTSTQWNRWRPEPQGPGRPQAPNEERRLAERLLRRSLAADPELTEARIRLAEVLGDRGEHEEARSELVRVLARPLSPLIEYHASLLLGREEQHAERPDAAREAFERALALYPEAQAPRMGLSHLAAARGAGPTALAALAPLTSRDVASTGDDPWFWIDRVHEPSADVLLASMREALSR
jgi:hypothetical protein